ncbi:putative transcription termination factor NusG [Roseibium sp. TrichSKD4]|nr:putative transcription termination factor NusG [Roseibium sp. TrichSKD4]
MIDKAIWKAANMSKLGEKQKKKLNPQVELLKALVRGYPLEWGVVYANPQCERRAFAGLINQGVVAHLPEERIERVQPRSKKTIVVNKPMFTRYLFAGIDRQAGQDWSTVRECDGVEGVLSLDSAGSPYLIAAHEMVALIKQLDTGERIADGTFIKVGQSLLLPKGVFAKFKMTVTAYKPDAETVYGEFSLFGRKTRIKTTVDDLVV